MSGGSISAENVWEKGSTDVAICCIYFGGGSVLTEGVL